RRCRRRRSRRRPRSRRRRAWPRRRSTPGGGSWAPPVSGQQVFAGFAGLLELRAVGADFPDHGAAAVGVRVGHVDAVLAHALGEGAHPLPVLLADLGAVLDGGVLAAGLHRLLDLLDVAGALAEDADAAVAARVLHVDAVLAHAGGELPALLFRVGGGDGRD